MQSSIESTRWRRVKEILDELAEVPSAERRAHLDRACAGDATLRDEVESFLELEDQADTFIDAPLWRAIPDAEEKRPPSSRLGPYRLERVLGQGGMGEVHLAVREDDYEQKVAIKRTLGPVLSDRSLQRFVNERQILANLQHPGIARLLDGGADENGRPYLVMEYVEGSQIDRYCAENELTIRQRLRLMSKVCRIVHHAHKNLVVHRDLKPSNILVSEDGQPRLLDFGIAKLLQADAGLTAQGTAALTPACASPEQIMGERVTTACDVYALGVLLYRLLAGRAPYDLDGLAFPVVRRIVCLQEVPRPSQAAMTFEESDDRDPDSFIVASAELEERAADSEKKLSARRRSRQLAGDLDAIVQKAMRKEPEHRYGSAAELADDIDRYLAGLPVEARRGSWFYHVGKHLRRNKPIVALMAMILMLTVAATGLAVKAERERRAAVAARDDAEVLKSFLVDILESPHPDRDKGRERTVREMVVDSLPKVGNLAGQPQIQSELLTILGKVFLELGDAERSLELHRSSLAITEEAGLPRCELLAGRTANVGSAYYKQKDYARAEELYRRALEIREQCGDDPLDLALTLNNLTNVQKFLDRGGISEAYEKVLDLRLRHGAEKGLVASSHYSLGTWALLQEETEKAIMHLEEALRLRREVDDKVSTGLAKVTRSLARAYHAAGRLADAESLYSESLDLHRQLYGEESALIVRVNPHVIRLLLDREKTDDAKAMAERTLELAWKHFTRDEAGLKIAESVWGACLARTGQAELARPLLEAGHRALVESAGPTAFATRWTLRELEKLE